MEIVAVLVAGGVGSLVRYLINKHLVLINILPFVAIAFINIGACFLLGLLLPISSRFSPLIKAALFTGFIGGLGTFTSYLQFALHKPITLVNILIFFSPLFLAFLLMIIGFWLGNKIL